jgi:hypothetical protein
MGFEGFQRRKEMKRETKIKLYITIVFCTVLLLTAFFLMGWKIFLGMFLFIWMEKILCGTFLGLKSERERNKLIKDLEEGLYKQQE